MRTPLLAVAAAALVVPPAAAAAAPAYTATVNSLYVPGDVSMLQGGTLTLVNGESIAHDLVSSDVENGLPLFQSGIVAGAGTSSRVTRAETLTPGVYPFYCSLHESMRGTLAVIAQ
jgi:plastocyanin